MAQRQFSSQSLALIVIAVAINMIGGQLISMLKLPVFLDSIGTLISAVLLGPLIGMLTGLITNLIWGLLTDPIAAAFAPVAMVIGLLVPYTAEGHPQRRRHYPCGNRCGGAYPYCAVCRCDRQRRGFAGRLDALYGPEPGRISGLDGIGRQPGR